MVARTTAAGSDRVLSSVCLGCDLEVLDPQSEVEPRRLLQEKTVLPPALTLAFPLTSAAMA